MAFDPGQHSEQVDQVRIDLIEARYAERQLTVTCAVVNEGETSVVVDWSGVLLDDEGLELPSTRAPGDPATITVGPRETIPVVFGFPVAAQAPRSRTLGFWVLRTGDAYLPPVRMRVPGIRTEPA